MPLPKTAPIAARATEVYCEVWSVILQRTSKMPPTRTSDLDDLSELLPYLRQLLTCCACAGLLDDAMISLTCGHCYCFDCQFREPLLKIPCRQCRERTGLVIESQLQLLVKCYKKMCCILGEELRRNPLVLGSKTVKSEPKEDGESTPKQLDNENIELLDDRENETNASPKESPVSTKTESTTTVVESNFDPITEIVREVEKGVKVSREVFVIKAPMKYRNTKAIAPKKEPVVSANPIDVSTPKKAPGEDNDQKITDTAADSMVGKVGKVGKVSKSTKGKKIAAKKSLRLKTMANLKKGRKRIVYKEVKGGGDGEPKRKKRKTLSLSTPDQADKSEELKPPHEKIRKKRTSKGKKAAESLTDKATTKDSASVDQPSQPLPLPASAVPKTEPVSSVGSPVTSQPPLPLFQAGLFDCNEIHLDNLPVAVSCFNKSCLKISRTTVTVLPKQRPTNVLTEALNHISLPSWKGAATKKKNGERKESTRKRKWGAMCPSVVVKRPRDAIVKMVMMQSKAAKGKRRMRYRSQNRQQQFSAALSRSLPSHYPPSVLPNFPQRSHHPLPPPPPPPPPLPPSSSHPYPAGDIPLPDDIPILQQDGNEDLLDNDINWKEFSDFLESNDEDTMSATLPPLGRYRPPRPLPPPLPHQHPVNDPRLNQMHFEKFNFPPRHFPPPYHHLGPPPPPPPPRHHHMPHPPSRLPPHGPHPPMMPPFSPSLRPDMPPHEGYFHHMGPEDFLPPGPPVGGGIIRPDAGGFSGPMTPGGSFPSGGVCHEGAYQHSPGHPHQQGGHFPPMPSPRMGFPPPRPGLFPEPLIMPKLKPKKRPMTGMVSKMKIKSPGTPPQKQKKPPVPTTPPDVDQNGQGQAKKRRSPGYSEAGWRCRCGTNNVMFPDKVCAKGKCPCYTKGIACKNCLCRHCHNPFGLRELNGTQSTDVPPVDITE